MTDGNAIHEEWAVELPAPQPVPAIHVVRRPITEPRSAAGPTFRLPRPPHPNPHTDFVRSQLLLPKGRLADPEIFDMKLGGGLDVLWMFDGEAGFFLSSAAREGREKHRLLPAILMATPAEVGIAISPEILRDISWRVLCRADPEHVIRVAASLSCFAEVWFGRPEFAMRSARFVGCPTPIEARLLAETSIGRPLFDPRCLRWVITDIAAAVASDAWEAPYFDRKSDHEYAERVLFSGVASDTWVPNDRDVARALWFLHADFRFTPFGTDIDPADLDPLSLLTALGSTTAHPLTWMERIDRWLAMWRTEDSDPCIASAPIRPSEIRGEFRRLLGVEIEGWLSGVMLLSCVVVRNAMFRLRLPLFQSLADFASVDRGPRLSTNFVAALERGAVSTVRELGTAAIAESSTFAGLGSLSRQDTNALRNAPIIQFDGGNIAISSVDLLATRAAKLPLHFQSLDPNTGLQFRQVSATAGHLFEGHVGRLLSRLPSSVRVIGPAEIASVVPKSQMKCDFIVVDGNHYLLIEASLQSRNRRSEWGDTLAIQDLCERYQHKADQAEATRAYLAAIAKAFNLAPCRRSEILVVVDLPLPPSPPVINELGRQRPGRNPHFVCGITELDRLVSLVPPVSLPSAVGDWRQSSASSVTSFLNEWTWIIGGERPVPASADSYDELLPLAEPPDATAA